MLPHPSLSALVIASATGLFTVTRSLVGAKSGRTRSLAATLAKQDLVTIHGCLPRRLKAGVKVRCTLGGEAASLPRGEMANLGRIECDGIIVGLQSTRHYGYQDVSVIVSQSDLPLRQKSGWRLEAIG
jgi:hypothetical protein